MSCPTDHKSLLRFIQLKYLNPFIANVACKTENLRYLTRSGIDYLWSEERINYKPLYWHSIIINMQ